MDSKKFAEEIEPQLLQRLEKMPFICGDIFTAADCVIAHSAMWARAYGLCHDDAFKRYLSSVSKRPAFMAAFADAREFSPAPPADKPITARFTG